MGNFLEMSGVSCATQTGKGMRSVQSYLCLSPELYMKMDFAAKNLCGLGGLGSDRERVLCGVLEYYSRKFYLSGKKDNFTLENSFNSTPLLL